jgi:hypothetical protein
MHTNWNMSNDSKKFFVLWENMKGEIENRPLKKLGCQGIFQINFDRIENNELDSLYSWLSREMPWKLPYNSSS